MDGTEYSTWPQEDTSWFKNGSVVLGTWIWDVPIATPNTPYTLYVTTKEPNDVSSVFRVGKWAISCFVTMVGGWVGHQPCFVSEA